MKLEKLIEVADLICVPFGGGDFPDSLKEELSLLLPEFIEDLFIRGRISDLQSRVKDASEVDILSIKRGLTIIEEANPPPLLIKPSGKTMESNVIVQRIKNQISLIENNTTDWGPLEIGLRLEMLLDSDFDYLLMACKDNVVALSQLEDLVIGKMEGLEEVDLLLLWARIKGLFEGESWTNPLRQYEEVTPVEFWKASSLDEIRKKCARFIVTLKPRIILRMIEEGADGYRNGVAGIAKILALHKRPAFLSNLDFLIVRTAAELVAATEKLTFIDPAVLARSIGKSPDGIIFQGHLYEEAKKGLGTGSRSDKDLKTLIVLMKKVIRYVSVSSGVPSNVEEQLWRYKLGHEVMAPKFTKEIEESKISEIDLQKDLCKFLLERGVRAYGKSFGRSQIDLYTKDSMGRDFVVETKVYKDAPSDGDIRANFTQLLSYMDQELERQPQGFLIIFNCSDSLVMAPREWVHQRVFVLAINIGHRPPSGRRKWIEIKEGDGPGQLLVVKDGKG